MGELNFLMSNYGTGEIIAILVVVLLLTVAVARAAGFVWEKLKNYFGIKNDEAQWRSDLSSDIKEVKEDVQDIQVKIEDLEEKADERGHRLEKVEEYTKKDHAREKAIIEHNEKIDMMCGKVQQRLQDDARWAFKDAYNYYFLKVHQIDEHSLEALERKFEHYKDAGGNSFVDTIMEQLRTLPIVEKIDNGPLEESEQLHHHERGII